jgi:biotin carboxyl carrier protein
MAQQRKKRPAALKLRVDFDGESLSLELRREDGGASEYVLTGASNESGRASIQPTMPGVFSVLLGSRSYTVSVAQRGSELEVWAAGRRHVITLSDPRDRTAQTGRGSAAGPVEIRAQMPGKVIKLLVEQGMSVKAGQAVIIVEAMKMQNEMKSPKPGAVRKIHVFEGGTVAAGETLMVIE